MKHISAFIPQHVAAQRSGFLFRDRPKTMSVWFFPQEFTTITTFRLILIVTRPCRFSCCLASKQNLLLALAGGDHLMSRVTSGRSHILLFLRWALNSIHTTTMSRSDSQPVILSVSQSMGTWMSESDSQWVGQWMSEWVSEWVSHSLSQSIRRDYQWICTRIVKH